MSDYVKFNNRLMLQKISDVGTTINIIALIALITKIVVGIWTIQTPLNAQISDIIKWSVYIIVALSFAFDALYYALLAKNALPLTNDEDENAVTMESFANYTEFWKYRSKLKIAYGKSNEWAVRYCKKYKSDCFGLCISKICLAALFIVSAILL